MIDSQARPRSHMWSYQSPWTTPRDIVTTKPHTKCLCCTPCHVAQLVVMSIIQRLGYCYLRFCVIDSQAPRSMWSYRSPWTTPRDIVTTKPHIWFFFQGWLRHGVCSIVHRTWHGCDLDHMSHPWPVQRPVFSSQ